jgi:hypothetical protein
MKISHIRTSVFVLSVFSFSALVSGAALPAADGGDVPPVEATFEASEELVRPPAPVGADVPQQDSPVNKWPATDLKLGQVAGVDIDSRGNVHVFHRGSRVWDQNSFNEETNRFRLITEGAIKEHTHLVLDKRTGNIVEKYGANRFYMPHGLTVDSFDNVWVTDVAMHQVFKIAPGQDAPSITIGEAFVPGSDNNHFCKPTAVAVAKSGEFFVADGYCNSRIVKFSTDGRFLLEFGKSSNGAYPPPAGTFNVPHSVTLVEDWNLLCVADRENERIQCFSAGLRHDPRALPAGTFIKKADGLGRVYAVDNLNHYLVGVTNSGLTNSRRQLFVVDLESGESRVSEPGLENPHDLAAAEDGTIYVAEIGPNRIIRVHL